VVAANIVSGSRVCVWLSQLEYPPSGLEGRPQRLNRLSNFAGISAAVGLGGAFVAAAGRVQLQSNKGVTITLQGGGSGSEVAVNLVGFRIAFEQPVN